MTASSARAEQLAAFYARHAERPQRIVRAKVRDACAQTIEDACQIRPPGGSSSASR